MINKIYFVLSMDFNIQQIQTGNTALYKEMVEHFWPRLFRFCSIYVNDRELAKDIVQEAFLSLWENKDSLSKKTELFTYLIVICRNKCLNFLRKNQGRYSIELTEETIYLKAGAYALEASSNLLIETKDLHTAIENALSTLRPKTREIFYLRYYEGLMVSEISERTQLAGKTVEYHLQRALKELQGKLSPSDFLLLFFFYHL